MSEPQAPQAPKAPETGPQSKAPAPAPTIFTIPIAGGTAAFGIETPAKEKVEPRLNINFNDKGEFGASILLDARKQTVESYGGAFKIKADDHVTTTFSVRAMPGKDAVQYGVQVKADQPKLDADFSAEVSTKGPQYKFGVKLPVNDHVTIAGKGSIGATTGGEGSVVYTNQDGLKANATAGYDNKRGAFVQGGVTIHLDHTAPKGPDANRAALAQLSPQDRALYEQAATAVRQYNEYGCPRLQEQETAAALAAMAKKEGMTRIDVVVASDAPDANGRQTIFAIQGDPRSESARKVYGDRDTLANTPVEASVNALNQTQSPQEQAPAQKPMQR